jgi:GH25 family lysozyme M1 (1,4-beta-N-acetylmuramidase)
MAQLIVTVNLLNKRSSLPNSFSDKNIIGTVQKGFSFEGNEATELPNPSLGTWYMDSDGHYYWGGGLLALDIPLGIPFNIKNLPIHIPSPCRLGIDISHHNTLNDWNAIKNSGVSFSYIKLSEGVGTPDVKAGGNASVAKQNGFKIGYYHFCRPDTRNGGTVNTDAIAEADEALYRMKPITKPDMPLVLDLEDQQSWDTPLQPAEYLIWINTFINRIKDKSGGECMIYSRKEYLERKLPPNHDLGKYRLWISLYSANDCTNVKCPVGWNDWAIWQYCQNGVIGSNTNLDINILKDTTLF